MNKTPLQCAIENSGTYNSPIGKIIESIDENLQKCRTAKLEYEKYPVDKTRYRQPDYSSAINFLAIIRIEAISQLKHEKTMSQDLYNSDWISIDGNRIHKTAVIHPNVVLGTGNTIGAYCVIGGNGEIRGVSQDDFKGIVVIGDNNVISELVTIQRPFNKGKKTIVCDNNLIMAHSHIGHDAYIGNDCEICTGSIIGGHVTIYDKAKIKLQCVIRNRLIIGYESVVGMGSVVTRNVPNFAIVYGSPAKELDAKQTLAESVEELRKECVKFKNSVYSIRKQLFVVWCVILIAGIINWIVS